MGLFCLLRGGVGLEYDLVLLGLHCFLRMAHALSFGVMPGWCCFLRFPCVVTILGTHPWYQYPSIAATAHGCHLMVATVFILAQKPTSCDLLFTVESLRCRLFR